MSGPHEQVEENANNQSGANPLRVHLRKVEARNKELEVQLAKAAEAQRKLAFFEAGVDPNSPAAKYFVKGYDGEITPEAIRMAAEEANIISLQKREIAGG